MARRRARTTSPSARAPHHPRSARPRSRRRLKFLAAHEVLHATGTAASTDEVSAAHACHCANIRCIADTCACTCARRVVTTTITATTMSPSAERNSAPSRGSWMP